MSYPREKRKTNHPVLRYGHNAMPVTWAHRIYNEPDTIRKRGKKWILIHDRRIVCIGTLKECRAWGK